MYLAIFLAALLFACFAGLSFVHFGASPRFAQARAGRRLSELLRLSDTELDEVLLAIETEKLDRRNRFSREEVTDHADTNTSIAAQFLYVHKKTYATGYPEEAATFMEKYFGATRTHHASYAERHRCNDTEGLEQPLTWNANFPATSDQPKGFSIHFVKNPLKTPQSSRMNASQLEAWLEKWRGNFSKTNRFDQFMDSHLGLVFESLDPLVEKWQNDSVPFICRTWCCGPGMPQFPDRCPSNNWIKNGTNTLFCEQGCYLEIPHGIIVEALCGLEGYEASRKCLTRVPAEKIKIFDLCRRSIV